MELITPTADNVTRLGFMENRATQKENKKKFKYNKGCFNPTNSKNILSEIAKSKKN